MPVAGNYPYHKYSAQDFVRIPGRERNYRNVITGEVMPRATYKRHYAPSIPAPQPLLLPARGRKSARKLKPAEQETELIKRKIKQREKQASKKIEKAKKRKARSPHSFSLRSFHKGYRSKIFTVSSDIAEINAIRLAAQRSRIISAYNVGLIMIDEDTGAERAASLFGARDIREAYTEKDQAEAEDKILNYHVDNKTGNLVTVGFWMRVYLTRAAAERNGIKFPEASLLKRR